MISLIFGKIDIVGWPSRCLSVSHTRLPACIELQNFVTCYFFPNTISLWKIKYRNYFQSSLSKHLKSVAQSDYHLPV